MTTEGLIKFLILILAITGGFVLGFGLSPRHKTTSSTITTIDTVIRYKPIPTNEKIEYARITLPRLLFAPVDTVYTATTDVVTPDGEKVEVTVPVERREYGDSTYRAVVSGVVVGDIHPTLEEIEIYQRITHTTTVESAKVPKLRPYIGASAGVYGATLFNIEAGCVIKGHHLPKFGYTNVMGKNIVEVGYGYIF